MAAGRCPASEKTATSRGPNRRHRGYRFLRFYRGRALRRRHGPMRQVAHPVCTCQGRLHDDWDGDGGVTGSGTARQGAGADGLVPPPAALTTCPPSSSIPNPLAGAAARAATPSPARLASTPTGASAAPLRRVPDASSNESVRPPSHAAPGRSAVSTRARGDAGRRRRPGRTAAAFGRAEDVGLQTPPAAEDIRRSCGQLKVDVGQKVLLQLVELLHLEPANLRERVRRLRERSP